ncbi:hypothetical protein ACI797_03310 [Geodermatophilus sp. SYSU D00691]
MPRPPHVPDHLRRRVFRGTQALRAGLLTKRELHGPVWQRLFPDVYAHRDVPVDHVLRARAAAGLLFPQALITGLSAAAVWGVDIVPEEDVVELTLPPGSNPVRIPGLRVRRAAVPAEWTGHRLGVRLTTPQATVARLAQLLSLEEAVVAVDRFAAAQLLDVAGLRDFAAELQGRGAGRTREVCSLADGRAESPQESRLRLLMLRGRLPPPVAQFDVRDGDGRFVARVDFAWPGQRVAVEYDGLWHAQPGQFARDRRRLNRLHAAGWRVLFVTAADLHRPGEILARLADLLGADAVRAVPLRPAGKGTGRTPASGYSQPLRLKPR